MTKDRLLGRISIDPEVCHGQACIRGTRITVSIILDCLAAGMSDDGILQEYPTLSLDDIRAASAYGAALAQEQVLPLPEAGL